MKSIFAFSLLFLSATFQSLTAGNPDSLQLKCTELNYEDCNLVLTNTSSVDEPIAINDIYIYDVEEEVSFNFDTKKYLPEDFNPLKGMYDLNWDEIELVEIDEEVFIEFDTKQYLPKDFNPLKGMYDLNWDEIELIEIEEEVVIDFDIMLYLPDNFYTSEGI